MTRTRSWLFWSDPTTRAERCRACVGAAIGFEILFGKDYDRMLRRDAKRLPATDKDPPP